MKFFCHGNKNKKCKLIKWKCRALELKGTTSYNNGFAQGWDEGHKASWALPSHIPQPKSVGPLGTLALSRHEHLRSKVEKRRQYGNVI